jgi:hypothetical protein
MITKLAALVFFVIFGFVFLYGEPAPNQLERAQAWQKFHDTGRR